MARLFYSLILTLALPFLFIRLLIQSPPSHPYRRRIGERFTVGRWPFKTDRVLGLIWIHAVSVGETAAAAPLIEELLANESDWQILVTSMTPTGSDHVNKLFGNRVLHCYCPYDVPVLMRRFIAYTRPALCVLMETELWPNLIHSCRKQKVPVMLANARMSRESARSYARLGKPVREMLRSIDCIAAQYQPDADRFIELGASSGRVRVAGSLKFSTPVALTPASPISILDSVRASGRRVIIAASTRDKEEEKVLDAFEMVLKSDADILLLLVPRHPQRFQGVAGLCEALGFNLQRRSEADNLSPSTNVLLGDSMGEMGQYFAVSDLAFVGGSLVDTGCQNVLEPAAQGLPIVVGPSQYNFASICTELEKAGALITVQDARGLATTLVSLLHAPERREAMARAGKELVKRNQQALPTHREIILGMLTGQNSV